MTGDSDASLAKIVTTVKTDCVTPARGNNESNSLRWGKSYCLPLLRVTTLRQVAIAVTLSRQSFPIRSLRLSDGMCNVSGSCAEVNGMQTTLASLSLFLISLYRA
jgi:hypothetical protein